MTSGIIIHARAVYLTDLERKQIFHLSTVCLDFKRNNKHLILSKLVFSQFPEINHSSTLLNLITRLSLPMVGIRKKIKENKPNADDYFEIDKKAK